MQRLSGEEKPSATHKLRSDESALEDRLQFANTLRGVAAMIVLASHFGYVYWRKPAIVGTLTGSPGLEAIISPLAVQGLPDFGFPDAWGHLGVALFFLVSGFVIPFSIEKLGPAGFAIGRILRIWPTYAVGFAVTLLCIALNSRLAGQPFPYRLIDVLKHLLIFPRWPTLSPPIGGIVWTLEVELFFYTICIVASSALRSYRMSFFAVGFVCLPLAAALGDASGILKTAGFSIYALAHWIEAMFQFTSFMMIGTAFAYHFRQRISGPALFVLSTCLLVASSWSWHKGVLSASANSGWRCFAVAVVIFAICYELDAVRRLRVFGNHVVLGWASRISYSLYVVHAILGYSIMTACMKIGAAPWQAVATAVAGVTIAASILHLLVEGPTHKTGRQLARKWTTREGLT